MKFHKIFLHVYFFVFLPAALIAETTGEALEVKKEAWNVGVALFDSEENDPSLLSISSVLSRLVRDELSQAETHILSAEEKIYIAEKFIEERVLKHIQTLEGHYKSRDNLLFEVNYNPDSAASVRKNIEKENKALEITRSLTAAQIVVPDSVKIVFPELGDGSSVWPINDIHPEIFRENNNLDILIVGSIVRIEEYFGIASYAWTPAGQRVLWEGAADNSELAGISRLIASEALSLLLGRPWTSLKVTVEPHSGIISVNGKLVGVGYWENRTILPGEATIEVSAHGYKPAIQIEKLEAGTHNSVVISLEKTEIPEILVNSEPPGAVVREGSLWLGTTPLSVLSPDRVLPLTLEKEGFRQRTVPLAPDTERLTIPLQPVTGDPEEKMKEARRKFDNSAAWFSLSLAPTLILFGISQNYRNMYNNSTNAVDMQTADTAYTVSNGVAWGSVAVNVGLFVFTLVRLAKYLKSVEELTE
ncbi:MAG: hypothetical protein B0D92_03040 [Spirochaeta sp. LUC14_002_19_P3]|nr:MAG: hypothetical protein B0D92_03040 [Spirochaeta sp. LUC14_002_19_P3]